MHTEMAISNYLAALIILLISYPFILVVVQMAVYDKVVRKKVSLWMNVAIAILFLVLLYLHLQTEVIYGKELLDAWNSVNNGKK